MIISAMAIPPIGIFVMRSTALLLLDLGPAALCPKRSLVALQFVSAYVTVCQCLRP